MTVTFSTPNVLATQPAGNVAASLLDANWAAAQAALSGVVASLADLLLAHDYTGTQAFGKGANLASGATLSLGSDGNYFLVTGTTTITAFSTKQAGCLILLRFNAALTLTYDATKLILQGAVDAVVAAGDVFLFVSEGGGNYREVARRITTNATSSHFLRGDGIYATPPSATGLAGQASTAAQSLALSADVPVGVQTGSPITFPVAFVSTPVVVCTPLNAGQDVYGMGLTAITTTTFTPRYIGAAGQTPGVTVQYVAVGT